MLDYGKDGNKYRNTDPYPRKEDYKHWYVYSGGECILHYGYGIDNWVEAETKLTQILDSLGSKTIDLHSPSKTVFGFIKTHFAVEESIHEDYKVAIGQYSDKSREIEKKWYDDLYAHYGVDRDDSVIQLLMSKAWEDGHANGFSLVEEHFCDYLEFSKEIIAAYKKKEMDSLKGIKANV